ncbi:MAG: phenylalanine--tRNA ligase subunit beta [Cyclobacteriaceae bacterium]|nr:phenylalanine--tRNA ligase subunit beta [Cyclobacteriaceae bacterium]
MKISYNWLRQYINIDKSPEALSGILTDTGLEVEGLEKFDPIKGGLQGLVIGKVLTCSKHPNADKLSITTVDIGNGTISPIVCGAPNVAEGQTVIVATVGATLYPAEGDLFKIKKAKIRGEVSEGMICAEDEIGVGKAHDGIMVLNTDLAPGTPALEYFDIETDYVFEIGLTPNRSDAISHLGAARDIKAVTEQEITWPSVEGFGKDDDAAPIQVSVENPTACPRYSGVTLTNITIAESPDWLKNRLLAIGLSPINNVVDITNFVMHETGQPLHAFDYAKIKGQKIVVKTLAANTPFITLDDKERKLKAEDLMICDSEAPMCIGGVFGGATSGVSDTTTSIFLESAYFDAASIRKSAMVHQLKTDASFRFERGTDPNGTVYALKRAALLLKELAGANISSEVVDVYPKPIKPWEVAITYRNINRLIGQEISKERIHSILNLLDIATKNISKDEFTAIIPTFRVDVTREADVIEEILRIYGFNNINLPENVGSSFLANSQRKDVDKIQQKISSYLVDKGYFEIMTNSLTKPEYTELSASLNTNESVEILNKLSEDLGVMRQSLLFSGLEVIARNINYKQSNLKVFEFGKQYFLKEGAYKEEKRLAVFITGLEKEQQWNSEKINVDFHQIKGVAEGVLARLNVTQTSVSKKVTDFFSYGLSYRLGEKTAMEIGAVNKGILKKIGIKQEIFYASFDWDLLLRKTNDNIMVKQVSKYPEVRRDLSLVINKSVSYQDILALSKKTERTLIKSVDVFDLYEGDRIESSKKAYSLKFILQDDKKTLTDKVIDKTMKRLMATFEKELGAIIRQ